MHSPGTMWAGDGIKRNGNLPRPLFGQPFLPQVGVYQQRHAFFNSLHVLSKTFTLQEGLRLRIGGIGKSTLL